jgi:hypothetical protein
MRATVAATGHGDDEHVAPPEETAAVIDRLRNLGYIS